MNPLFVVSATRLSAEQFWRESALGRSLERLRFSPHINPMIAFSNGLGLPTIYNRAIHAAPAGSLLLFIHDDAWIEDAFIYQRIVEGLSRFDVLGVAGGRMRSQNQSSWYVANPASPSSHLEGHSGGVAHGQFPFSPVDSYGPTPMACDLLDGVLLAARRDVLIEKKAFFDERFQFHFYDLDFCRTAKSSGLQPGTWPISITHQGRGNWNNPEWRSALQSYLSKWAAHPGAL
ncbi:glycosyltransferase, partial [Ottowia sp.]|uniref:glycosyltransferase n=1 Tax=Ottowia sp. TaxID=1898956 RepID=UPI002CEEFC5E